MPLQRSSSENGEAFCGFSIPMFPCVLFFYGVAFHCLVLLSPHFLTPDHRDGILFSRYSCSFLLSLRNNKIQKLIYAVCSVISASFKL